MVEGGCGSRVGNVESLGKKVSIIFSSGSQRRTGLCAEQMGEGVSGGFDE